MSGSSCDSHDICELVTQFVSAKTYLLNIWEIVTWSRKSDLTLNGNPLPVELVVSTKLEKK